MSINTSGASCASVYVCTRIHMFAHWGSMITIAMCNLRTKRQFHEEQLQEETVLSRSFYHLLDKVSYLTAFSACDNSPHLLVTPAQLMRHGIGWNASCAVGDFVASRSILSEMWFIDCSCMMAYCACMLAYCQYIVLTWWHVVHECWHFVRACWHGMSNEQQPRLCKHAICSSKYSKTRNWRRSLRAKPL